MFIRVMLLVVESLCNVGQTETGVAHVSATMPIPSRQAPGERAEGFGLETVSSMIEWRWEVLTRSAVNIKLAAFIEPPPKRSIRAYTKVADQTRYRDPGDIRRQVSHVVYATTSREADIEQLHLQSHKIVKNVAPLRFRQLELNVADRLPTQTLHQHVPRAHRILIRRITQHTRCRNPASTRKIQGSYFACDSEAARLHTWIWQPSQY